MDTPHSGHAALRRGRVSAPGHVYLVTFTTWRRRPVFSSFPCATVASSALADRRLWLRSTLLAWALMPDHWHGLVQLGTDESLSRLIGRLKCNSARRLRMAGYRARVWAPAFHDRGIRGEAALTAAARYVIANPLRAGLAPSLAAYPFWDAVWLHPGLSVEVAAYAAPTCGGSAIHPMPRHGSA
jgi:REP element-mobilizing transposase RayT